MIELLNIFQENKVIPVAAFDSIDDSFRIVELLLKNSISIVEITARTKVAFQCIEQISIKFPEIIVGAGSILSDDTLRTANNSGAQFAVSPCYDPEIVNIARVIAIPFVPGVATPSELRGALKTCTIIKVFPAEQLGGPAYIEAMIAPFALSDFHLMPTGGVNEFNYKNYLKTERVISCGMSYIVDKKLIHEKKFDELDNRMKEISF